MSQRLPVSISIFFMSHNRRRYCWLVYNWARSVFTYRPLRAVQNFYIVSLAFADLAVALLVMPLNVANFVLDGRWAFGVVVCHVWLTADILTCTASILNLCAIALDRYRAIHDPIGYAQRRTIGRVLTTVAVVWTTSAIISVPPLIGWNATGLYDESTQRCQLTDDRGFVVYSAAGSFYIPLALMTFVYIKIYVATRRRLRARTENYRVTVAATSASIAAVACCTARATPERGDENAQPTLTPTHRECRPRVDVPSIESLTNDDEYDVGNDNDDVGPTIMEGSATSAAVACRLQPETEIDRIFEVNPPSTTDIAAATNQQAVNVLTTSLKDRRPEVAVDKTLNDRRNEHPVYDVTETAFNVCTYEYSTDRRQTAHRMVTGRPEVEIAATKSDCTDIVAVSGRPTRSAEVKKNASTELRIRSTRSTSAKKRRRWSAENCVTRRLSRPALVGQSKWISMAAVGKPQSTPENGSSTVDQSIGGRSQVVGRVMAEKQRQATMKERRVARTMGVIMAAFVVCWLPFFVIYVLFPFCGSACSQPVGERFVTFIVWLGYVNSTINPVIYTVFNVDFRRAFKSLLSSGRCCRRRATR